MTVPAQGTPGKAHRWERRQQQDELAAAETSNLLAQMEAHLGGLLTLAKAPPQSDVLVQATYALSTEGIWSATWPVNFAAVYVANRGTATLTVVAGPPQAQPPARGTGIFTVAPNVYRVLPLRSTVLTLYGAEGAVFDLVAFVRPREPSSGLLVAGQADTVTNPGYVRLLSGSSGWPATVIGPAPNGAIGNGLVVVDGGNPVKSLTAKSAAGTAGTACDNGFVRAYHTLQVTTSPGVTAGKVLLQGSLDGVHFFALNTAITTVAATTTYGKWSTVAARYVRAFITAAITGGTVTAWVGSE